DRGGVVAVVGGFIASRRRHTRCHVLSNKALGIPLFRSLGKRLTHLPERSFCFIDHLEGQGASGQLLCPRCNRCQCRSYLLQCCKIGRIGSIVDGLSSESSSRWT